MSIHLALSFLFSCLILNDKIKYYPIQHLHDQQLIFLLIILLRFKKSLTEVQNSM